MENREKSYRIIDLERREKVIKKAVEEHDGAIRYCLENPHIVINKIRVYQSMLLDGSAIWMPPAPEVVVLEKIYSKMEAEHKRELKRAKKLD